MSHTYDEQRILDYLEGDLAQPDREAFEVALEQDPPLRALVERLAADRATLRHMPVETPPSALMDTVNDHLERELLLEGPPSVALPFRHERTRIRLDRFFIWSAVAAMLLLSASLIVLSLYDPATLELARLPEPDAVSDSITDATLPKENESPALALGPNPATLHKPANGATGELSPQPSTDGLAGMYGMRGFYSSSGESLRQPQAANQPLTLAQADQASPSPASVSLSDAASASSSRLDQEQKEKQEQEHQQQAAKPADHTPLVRPSHEPFAWVDRESAESAESSTKASPSTEPQSPFLPDLAQTLELGRSDEAQPDQPPARVAVVGGETADTQGRSDDPLSPSRVRVLRISAADPSLARQAVLTWASEHHVIVRFPKESAIGLLRSTETSGATTPSESATRQTRASIPHEAVAEKRREQERNPLPAEYAAMAPEQRRAEDVSLELRLTSKGELDQLLLRLRHTPETAVELSSPGALPARRLQAATQPVEPSPAPARPVEGKSLQQAVESGKASSTPTTAPATTPAPAGAAGNADKEASSDTDSAASSPSDGHHPETVKIKQLKVSTGILVRVVITPRRP